MFCNLSLNTFCDPFLHWHISVFFYRIIEKVGISRNHGLYLQGTRSTELRATLRICQLYLKSISGTEFLRLNQFFLLNMKKTSIILVHYVHKKYKYSSQRIWYIIWSMYILSCSEYFSGIIWVMPNANASQTFANYQV